jgi:hypothetical protein
MASKIKVDTLETGDGTGNIILSNQFSGMTTASLPSSVVTEDASGNVDLPEELRIGNAKKLKFKSGSNSSSRYWQVRNDDSGYGYLGFKYSASGSDSTYTSSLQLTGDGRGLSQFTARSWACWEMVAPASILDSHNVSSLTDNGTGDSTIFHDVDFTNLNYAWGGGSDDLGMILALRDHTYAQLDYTRFASTNSSGSFDDSRRLTAIWFGE